MLETILPFAALLAGSGFGELIKKYIYIGRAGDGDAGSTSRGRPRVQVTGPKVHPEICQICMGKIKEGSEYVRCSNGKVFHSVCLARVGNCPYCRRTFAIKGRESSTSREYVQPIVPAEAPAAIPSSEGEGAMVQCPVCGNEIDTGSSSCPCGAIFVADGGSFPCPICGGAVKEGDSQCGGCGERFQQFLPVVCPVCGKPIAANAEVCSCGAILANRCPECGAELAENESVCGTCGAAFEFV